jgi:hypothetical protein
VSDYVQEQVIEALKAAKGLRAPAKRKLASLCANDQRFLLDLVGPHLSAILDHAIHHYAHAELDKMAKPTSKPVQIKTSKGTLGEALLRRFAGQNTPVFGMDDPNQGTGKRPAASAQHRAAIDKIAKRVEKQK